LRLWDRHFILLIEAAKVFYEIDIYRYIYADEDFAVADCKTDFKRGELIVRRASSGVAVVILGIVLAGLAPAAWAEDWQPISKEDLALKDNPAHPGSHAMILYRESSVDTTEASVSEYVRIKIFTEEGKKFGDVEIPFVKREGGFDIHDVRARTIRPDGTIVNFDGKVFEKEVFKIGGVKELEKTFSLPDVQPGCIVEYKYREQHDRDYFVEPVWILNRDLYTRFGRFSFHPYKEETDYQMYWRRYLVPTAMEPKKQPDGSYIMEVHDLPGIDEEKYMLPKPILQSRVEFFYRSPDEPADEKPDHYWKRTGKKWNDDMEHFINRRGALEAELGQIIAPSDPPEAKLRKIYARVQKIRDTYYEIEKTKKEQKQENLKKNDNVEDLLKRGYGTERQINFLFIALARTAGFDATSVYVAPRNNNFFHEQMEDSSEIDDDIVWVKLDNADVYLDPASGFYPYGLLPWYETGVKGLRLNKQGGDFITTTEPALNDARLERQAEVSLDGDGNLSGKVTVDFLGQLAAIRREDEREEDDAGRKKYMTDLIHQWLSAESSFEITQMTGWEDNNAPLHIEGKIHMAGFGATTGRRILAPATIFRSAEAEAFEPAKRVNLVYFHYPYVDHDEIILHIPDGYRIETAPPAIKTPEAVMDYSLTATPQGSIVHIDRRLNVKQCLFEVKLYAAIRDFFNQVKGDDESQLVLTSAQSQSAEKK